MEPSSPFAPTISNEATAALPAVSFDGEIRIIDTEAAAAAACDDLMSSPVIGFDTETRPSFRAGVTNRVALLQLSTPRCCYLFRLNRIRLDKTILKVLTSSEVLKIGADVAGDLRSLHVLRHFREAGFVDLQQMMPEWGIEERSLRKMSALILGKRVSKAQRLSNWEAVQLTPQQQLYAATDAWVCTAIYDKLQRLKKSRQQKNKKKKRYAESANPPAQR